MSSLIAKTTSLRVDTSADVNSTSIPDQHSQSHKPAYALQPLNEAEDSSFSKSWSGFCRRQQHLLSLGWPSDMVLGPYEVELDAVFSERGSSTAATTVSQWVASTILPFEDLGVPEKLGLMLLFGRFTRWRILQSLETYDAMPECMKPTVLQLTSPHPVWIDFIPW